MGYQSAHHDQLDHARVRRDVQKTESERSEEFHIQPTLLLGLALTTSISFNLFLPSRCPSCQTWCGQTQLSHL